MGLSRRARLRLALFSIGTAFLVLADEIIREGYMINPVDFVNPRLTHEKIFLILFLIGIFLGLRRRNEC